MIPKVQQQSELKWSDSKQVKEELDRQIFHLLGPLTEEDKLKPAKKKAPKQVSEAVAKKGDTKTGPQPDVPQLCQYL